MILGLSHTIGKQKKKNSSRWGRREEESTGGFPLSPLIMRLTAAHTKNEANGRKWVSQYLVRPHCQLLWFVVGV